MPYHNMPRSMWPKMERCVQDVMASGKAKENAIAICYSQLMQKERESFVTRVKTMLQARIVPKTLPSASLSIFKDAQGNHRWVTFTSNAFQDLDREIVSQKALEDDIARTDKEGNYGPLRWWHVGVPDPVNRLPGPGVDLGDCDFSAMHGRILVESGTFKDARVAARLAEHGGEFQVSMGFFHPATEPDREGVYHSIHRFERSLVPAGRAANPLTGFQILREGTMLKEKIAALRKLFGDPAIADQALAGAEQLEQKATEAGAAFKESANLQTGAPADDAAATATDVTEKAPPGNFPPRARQNDNPPPPQQGQAQDNNAQGNGGTQRVADLSVDEFAVLLGKAFTDALAAMDEGGAPEDQAAQPGSQGAPQAQQKEIERDERFLTAFKTLGDILVSLGKDNDVLTQQLKGQGATLAEVQAAVKRLDGNVPAAFKDRRATQDPATAITPEQAQGRGPHADPQAVAGKQGAVPADPLANFFDSFVFSAQNQNAQPPDGSRSG